MLCSLLREDALGAGDLPCAAGVGLACAPEGAGKGLEGRLDDVVRVLPSQLRRGRRMRTRQGMRQVKTSRRLGVISASVIKKVTAAAAAAAWMRRWHEHADRARGEGGLGPIRCVMPMRTMPSMPMRC